MIPNRIVFEVAFPTIPTSVVEVWIKVANFLERKKCLPKQFYVSQIAGHDESYHKEELMRLNRREIESLISERELRGFRVSTGHSSISVGFTLAHMKELGQQSILSCRIEKKAKAPNDWTQLIELLMIQWSSIGGWQRGSLYLAWQNSESLNHYERFYGPIPDSIKTQLAPKAFPLEVDREVIDSSLNPGRIKYLLPGIYFIPSAEIWLGPHFWQYAKCTKEEALAADFFLEKRDTPHFLYLKSWAHAFTRPDGEQGRQQQRIWKLFFNEDCEWPPGSGDICDEPMYGPPELMPKSIE